MTRGATGVARLGRALHARLPDQSEVAGLFALMLLTDARRPARTKPEGELIPLDKQDRSLWNHSAIGEGVALISATLAKGAIGPYQLRAAIAAVHDEAKTAEDTDWPQILALYGLLKGMSDNPMVLKELDDDERLVGHYRIAAVRAHLLEHAGDRQAAIEHYRVAADRTTNTAERDYLINQAVRLTNARTKN